MVTIQADADALADLSAVALVLAAFLVAHSREQEPSAYRRALLLQASAQLATLPCVLCSGSQPWRGLASSENH